MAKAIVLYSTGGPENLLWSDWAQEPPAAHQVRIRHTVSGLNFIDTYYRAGIYTPPFLPMVLGREAVGVVETVGKNVTDFKEGDRVVYVGQFGAYGETNNVDAKILIPLPSAIPDDTVAAMMLKGMTAQYLLRQTVSVGPKTTLLYHAAAGGVGLIACQWAKHLGARVIGTVGSDEKAELARSYGCEHVINYEKNDLTKIVMEITDGEGVDYICDGVGAKTYEESIKLLKHHGTIAIFGAASGPIVPDSLAKLPPERFLVRTTLPGYTKTRDRLQASATDLFNIVQSGVVKISINQRYNIKDAGQAHSDLENRKTTGSTVLEFD